MSDEKIEQTPREGGETLKITRRDFLRDVVGWLGGGSLAAFLTACGINQKDLLDKAPTVSIDELAFHPDLYAELPLIITYGYPEQTGKRVVAIPIMKMVPFGETSIMHIDWITTETDTYKLHSESNAKSNSVDFIVSGGTTYFPYVSLQPGGSNLMMKDKYQLTGKMVKVREDNNKTEKYMFQPSDVKKLEVPTPPPGK